ncbi:MAG: tail fiber protein [Myxococcales bacterium]|nr:tail fiber protein [Myxococcales bacterium]
MRRRLLASTLALMTVTTLGSEFAYAVPSRLALQGQLQNAGGALQSGVVGLDVRLYSDETGGAPVWAETHAGVPIKSGVFSLQLGTKSALTAGIFADDSLWVGITVDGGVELARVPISTVTHSFRSGTAESAEDVDCAGCIEGSDVAVATLDLDRLNGMNCSPGDAILFGASGFECGPAIDSSALTDSTEFGGDVVGNYDSLALGSHVVASDNLAPGAVDAAALAASVADQLVPPGTVVPFAGTAAPAGWLLCDGAAVSRATHSRLFALVGITWGGGDGVTTFNVPDLRGRSIVGAGAGVGLTARAVGANFGAEAVSLTLDQLPSHSHTGTADSAGGHSHGASSGNAGDHTHSATESTAGAHSHTASTGAAGAHSHSVGDAGSHSHTYLRPALTTDVDRGSNGSKWSLDDTQNGTTDSAGNHSHSLGSAPDHSHSVSVDSASGHTHTVTVQNGGTHSHAVTIDAAAAHTHPFTTNPTGGGAPVPTAPPSASLHYIIKL